MTLEDAATAAVVQERKEEMRARKDAYDALREAQTEALSLNLPKNRTNPHYGQKYTPLDVILDALIPVLNRHGILLVQSPGVTDSVDPQGILITRLFHGAYLVHESMMFLLPGKKDPQGQGAAITYARRYAIMSILGLTSDEDDDGNSSMAPAASPRTVVVSPKFPADDDGF